MFFTQIDTDVSIPRADQMEKNPRHDAKNKTLPNKAILKCKRITRQTDAIRRRANLKSQGKEPRVAGLPPTSPQA